MTTPTKRVRKNPGEAGTSRLRRVRPRMYMAAGSGIPEIKTILPGFVIPHFLGRKVFVIKAPGAAVAVSTGMCLGKDILCIYLRLFSQISGPRSEAQALTFSYEISTFFPRRVLWKAFLCSLLAATTLRELNPSGIGKLVLYESDYGENHGIVQYLVFMFLGIGGGIFERGSWTEDFLTALVMALFQYPHRLIRRRGDIVMPELLANCKGPTEAYVWQLRALENRSSYYLWLISGTLVKPILTVITYRD
ncbi:hypothetical protein NKR23_g7671 [Pleurostoma richardsiae]|uniref:Uncharacterized protein n=1 Tax=Pleurostoma richardsiae TaxID=41990 RepID=A0AA38VDA2_9PEZI|nr:hypothetical protein NKR23_g7671 [Pleurostoma richardsiae]